MCDVQRLFIRLGWVGGGVGCCKCCLLYCRGGCILQHG